MHAKVALALMIFAFPAIAVGEASWWPPGMCFSRATDLAVVRVRGAYGFEIIPKGGVPAHAKRVTDSKVRVGDTVVVQGRQFQSHLELIKVDDDRAIIHHYGWVRGSGPFDETRNVALNAACIKNGASGGKAANDQ